MKTKGEKMSKKEVCRELKELGMSDKKIARIVYGEADEWNVIMVGVLTTTPLQRFFETLFEYQELYEARAFLVKCRPLV